MFREKKQPSFENLRKKFKPLERVKQGAAWFKKEALNRKELDVFGISRLFSKIDSDSFIPKTKLSSIKLPSFPRLNLLRSREKIKWRLGKKEIITIISLVVLIWAGRRVNRMEKGRRVQETQSKLEIVQEKRDTARSLYQRGREEEARKLYLDIWTEMVNLSKTGAIILPEVVEIKDQIEKEMYEVNKIQELEGIEPMYKFEEKEFLPQSFVVSDGKLFFSTPYSDKIAELEKGQEPVFREVDLRLLGVTAIAHDNKVIFFGEKGKIIMLGPDLTEPEDLISEEEAASFSLLSSFRSNLYFWQEKEKQIIRLSYLGDFTWEKPEFWLGEPVSGSETSVKSMALDGGIWLLKGNELFYFYKGDLEKRMRLAVFPEIRDLGKVYTSENTLEVFISEPVRNRILVIDKESGSLVAQYKNPQFNNIKDLEVKDGLLYILSGAGVYEIEL